MSWLLHFVFSCFLENKSLMHGCMVRNKFRKVDGTCFWCQSDKKSVKSLMPMKLLVSIRTPDSSYFLPSSVVISGTALNIKNFL